jgi:hypothetical protein
MRFKLADLRIVNENSWYIFEHITGTLLKKDISNFEEITKKINGVSKKVIDIKCLNDNPYQLNNKIKNFNLKIKNPQILKLYGVVLTNLTKKSFLLGKLFANMGLINFETSADAINFYRKNIYPTQQNDLCLPRTLFAASSSKLFKQKGVIFIGVSLPSNSMHAWIIEDAKQPDSFDNIWINFQPVAAIY